MTKERKIDISCMERLAQAVSSMLLCSDLNKGIASAFISISPIQPRDFPTKRLAEKFKNIEEKHLKEMKKCEEKECKKMAKNKTLATDKRKKLSDSQESLFLNRNPSLFYLRYSYLSGPTKHWFKKQIWELLYACLHHNK